jgi:DNA primase
VVIVESELDSLLVDQEAGDIVGVIALGSVDQRPDSALDKRLMTIKNILISFDNNAAGNASADYWLKKYPGARRWPPGPPGKDPSEMYQAGESLRRWIEGGLIA